MKSLLAVILALLCLNFSAEAQVPNQNSKTMDQSRDKDKRLGCNEFKGSGPSFKLSKDRWISVGLLGGAMYNTTNLFEKRWVMTPDSDSGLIRDRRGVWQEDPNIGYAGGLYVQFDFTDIVSLQVGGMYSSYGYLVTENILVNDASGAATVVCSQTYDLHFDYLDAFLAARVNIIHKPYFDSYWLIGANYHSYLGNQFVANSNCDTGGLAPPVLAQGLDASSEIESASYGAFFAWGVDIALGDRLSWTMEPRVTNQFTSNKHVIKGDEFDRYLAAIGFYTGIRYKL